VDITSFSSAFATTAIFSAASTAAFIPDFRRDTSTSIPPAVGDDGFGFGI
jgi:hypothetical protein